MQVKTSHTSETETTITVVSSENELSPIKEQVLRKLARSVKLPGFREGKAPLTLIEKNIDTASLQTEFLEQAINQLYPQAIQGEKLRPVSNPDISIKKFVPFTTLEFEAKVAVVGKVTLADYSKLKVEKPKVTISAADVDEVLHSLQKRMAVKNDVDRAAKANDQVWIDFEGTDTKGEKISGADGKDYPLLLGSNTFIPGFEPELIGLAANDTKTFNITFPKDYGVKAMASKKVTFAVTMKKVQEVVEPQLDDAFAAQSGPFKTLKELKDDIKRQLQIEREQQAERDYESEIVRLITSKSKVTVPQVLIDEQVERMINELKQNLLYRGQTYDEYLESQGTTEEEWKANNLAPQAEERVKASLVLTEISEKEKLDVSVEELNARITELKAQYTDAAMQTELNKPENRQDIASRLLTEKTLQIIKKKIKA